MKTLVIYYAGDVELYVIENLDPKFMALQNQYLGVSDDVDLALFEEFGELIKTKVEPKDVGQTDNVLLTGYIP